MEGAGLPAQGKRPESGSQARGSCPESESIILDAHRNPEKSAPRRQNLDQKRSRRLADDANPGVAAVTTQGLLFLRAVTGLPVAFTSAVTFGKSVLAPVSPIVVATAPPMRGSEASHAQCGL